MSVDDDTDETHSSIDALYLDKPVTKKELDGNDLFGFGSMQGWRKSNEDAAKYLIPFDNHLWKDWSYFAVFDGHNGVDTSHNARDLLDKYLLTALNKNETINIDDALLEEVIKKSFNQLDECLKHLVRDRSGSVCVCISIESKELF